MSEEFRFKTPFSRLFLVIILGMVLFMLGILAGYYISRDENNSNTNQITSSVSPSPSTSINTNGGNYFYHGFPLPFKLSDADVSKSYTNGDWIQQVGYSENWVNFIESNAKSTGWVEKSRANATDGGSIMVTYANSNDDLQVEIFYKYSLEEGKFIRTDVRFLTKAVRDLENNSSPSPQTSSVPIN